MEYVERVEEEIRNNWFKNHVAEIEGKESLQVIYWKQPGTMMYQTKYVLSGNNVFISGDIGEAVYTLTCAATLENIKDFNLGYFTGKLSAFCEERWDFDDKKAKEELEEYWDEYDMHEIEDSKEIFDGITSAIDESSSVEAFGAWLVSVYENTSADSDLMSYVSGFGRRMPARLIGYWVGLKMIIEQVEQKKESA